MRLPFKRDLKQTHIPLNKPSVLNRIKTAKFKNAVEKLGLCHKLTI